MSWHYLPVWREHDAGRTVTLCEVYLDAADELVKWTENPSIAPSGANLMELLGDLTQMLSDALKWQPVAFDSLKSRMTFEERSDD